MDGWVKIFRKSINSQVFQNDGLWKTWTWCLMKANRIKTWVPIRIGRGITEVELMPGQFIFGRNSASKALGANPSTVWKRMLKLKSIGNCDIQSGSHYSVVSIINWESYQNSKTKGDNQSDNQVTGKEQPSNTDKKEKNILSDSKFDKFWNLYNKKTGKQKTHTKFKKLKEKEIELIFQTLPAYIQSTPDPQYRKNPLTYLNGKHWEDETTDFKHQKKKVYTGL